MVENFMMDLDPKVRRMVEDIDPTTYETALRIARTLEKPGDEVHRESTVTIG